MVYYKIQGSIVRIPVGKIVGLIRTYPEHAQEMNSPVLEQLHFFLKPESAVIFNNQVIRLPPQSAHVHHEVELGVIIGKTCTNCAPDHALEYVFGYLVGLDITARDIQTDAKKQGLPWGIAKGFDTFAPLSDVVLKKSIPHPNNLEIELQVNGVVKQHSNTKHMVCTVEQLISYISSIMTLKRGDLILTGTPEGIGEIQDGDRLDARLDSYCSLHVTVKKNNVMLS